MPVLDGEDKVVGLVQMEKRDLGSYSRCYLVLDFGTHKLKVYPEEAEDASNLGDFKPEEEINCQYITKVGIASARPKALNCFEIGTTTGVHVFSVDSAEEREDWVESIRKSSMRQGSAKQVVSALRQKQKKEVGYQTKVVAGVVHRTPIQSTGNSDAGTDSETAQGGAGVSSVGRGDSISRRKEKGIPRVIKAGHAIKLGAVMRNWKRRFFVLTEASLGYYKSIEEVEPIRTISVGEIASVQPSKDTAGKEHMFEVVTPSRTFYVQADKEEDMQDWVRVLQELLRAVKPSLQPPEQPVMPDSNLDSDEELGTLV